MRKVQVHNFDIDGDLPVSFDKALDPAGWFLGRWPRVRLFLGYATRVDIGRGTMPRAFDVFHFGIQAAEWFW